MALRLALKLTEQLALGGNLQHLVIDHTVRIRDGSQESQQVGGDVIAVDRHRQIRPHVGRQVDDIHIHQIDGLDHMVTEVQVFVRALEVPHGERALSELEGHEAVQVFIHLIPA